jgi:hypothetical protein
MKFSSSRLFSQKNLLIFIIAFFVFNNALWWLQNKFIQGPDEGKHLFLSLLNLKRFPEQVFWGFEPSEAPFYYLTAGFFYNLFHSTSYYISMVNNVLYTILLLIGVSRLERLFLGSRGLLSPLILMLIPQMAVHSRFFNPDIALCAMLVCFFYFLKKLYGAPRMRYFFALIMLISIGTHTKVSFFTFCLPLTLYYLFLSFKDNKPIKARYIFILAAAQFMAFYVFYPQIADVLKYQVLNYGKEKVFYAQAWQGISQFVIPFKYYEKSLLGKIQEELFLLVNSHLSPAIFAFFVFSLICLITSRIKKEDKIGMAVFFLGSLFAFTFTTSLHLEDRYLLPLAIFESIIIAYGVKFLLERQSFYKLIVASLLIICLAQYYGISYSRRFIEYFSKLRAFNTVINLTYYPFTSQGRVIWSLPYRENPTEEIVATMQDNFKKGLDYKVYFLDTYILDDYTKSSFAFFISRRVNYYALKSGLPLETLTTMDIRDAGILIVKAPFLHPAEKDNNCCSAFSQAKLIPQEGEQEFKEFCENANFKFFKKVSIYNPVSDENEEFMFYLRANRNFLSEETRKLSRIFKGFKLFVVLQDNTVLDIARSAEFRREGDNFSIVWPKDNFSVKGRIEPGSDGRVSFTFFSDRASEIKLIQMAISVFSGQEFYFKDKDNFKLLEGKLEVPTLMSNNRFSEGLRTSGITKYFSYQPRIAYADYFSQVEFVNKREIDIVFGLRPFLAVKDQAELFSIGISDTLANRGAP